MFKKNKYLRKLKKTTVNQSDFHKVKYSLKLLFIVIDILLRLTSKVSSFVSYDFINFLCLLQLLLNLQKTFIFDPNITNLDSFYMTNYFVHKLR